MAIICTPHFAYCLLHEVSDKILYLKVEFAKIVASSSTTKNETKSTEFFNFLI